MQLSAPLSINFSTSNSKSSDIIDVKSGDQLKPSKSKFRWIGNKSDESIESSIDVMNESNLDENAFYTAKRTFTSEEFDINMFHEFSESEKNIPDCVVVKKTPFMKLEFKV